MFPDNLKGWRHLCSSLWGLLRFILCLCCIPGSQLSFFYCSFDIITGHEFISLCKLAEAFLQPSHIPSLTFHAWRGTPRPVCASGVEKGQHPPNSPTCHRQAFSLVPDRLCSPGAVEMGFRGMAKWPSSSQHHHQLSRETWYSHWLWIQKMLFLTAIHGPLLVEGAAVLCQSSSCRSKW